MRKDEIAISPGKLMMVMKNMGLQPMELSRRSGVSRQNIHNLLESDTGTCKSETLEKIIKGFNYIDNGYFVAERMQSKMIRPEHLMKD